MSEETPDWLAEPESVDSRHLAVIRRVLASDYLRSKDWRAALADLASMAREALDAERAMVAVFRAPRHWTAVTESGLVLADEAISDVGSTSVLERVRNTAEPVLTLVGQELQLESKSAQKHHIGSVLAVPIYFNPSTGERRLSACLYVHRGGDRPQFEEPDVVLVGDLARIAEPKLDILNLFARGMSVSEPTAEPGSLVASDSPRFVERVINPLLDARGAASVQLIGPPGSGKATLARRALAPAEPDRMVEFDAREATGSDDPFERFPDQDGVLLIRHVDALAPDHQRGLLARLQGAEPAPRIVTTTTRDLEPLVYRLLFREDLLWRIREATVRVLPLNERLEDLPRLAREILGGRDCRLSESGLAWLRARNWSSEENIRGLALRLRAASERAAEITAEVLAAGEAPPTSRS